MGGDEDHRRRHDAQDPRDRAGAVAARAEVDVGQHEARPLGTRDRHRLRLRCGGAHDAVAAALHQLLDVEGDDRLVLDDQHPCRGAGERLLLGRGRQRQDPRGELHDLARAFGTLPPALREALVLVALVPMRTGWC